METLREMRRIEDDIDDLLQQKMGLNSGHSNHDYRQELEHKISDLLSWWQKSPSDSRIPTAKNGTNANSDKA